MNKTSTTSKKKKSTKPSPAELIPPLPTVCGDIMVAPTLIKLQPQHTLMDAVRVFLAHGIRHVPIVDPDNPNKLVGILSERDVRVAMESPLSTDPATAQSNLERFKIDKIMSKENLTTANPQTPILEAALILKNFGIGCLPLLDLDSGDLLGIVTMSDMLNTLIIFLQKKAADAIDAEEGTSTVSSS